MQTVLDTFTGQQPPPPESNSSGDSSKENSSQDGSSSSSENEAAPHTYDCRVCNQTLGDVNVLTCHGCSKKVHKGCRIAFRIANTHEMRMCTSCSNDVFAKMQEIRQECRDIQRTWAEMSWVRSVLRAHKDNMKLSRTESAALGTLQKFLLKALKEWSTN